MAKKRQNKKQRARVSIYARSSVLRLRWTYQNSQREMSLKLKDTPRNRKAAKQQAQLLENDLKDGTYDESLERYRPRKEGDQTVTSTVKLFERFIEHKRREGVSAHSLSTRYKALRSNLLRLQRDINTPEDAWMMVELLRSRQSPLVANQNLSLLKSFGEWLFYNRYLDQNPFERIKPQRKSSLQIQNRTPFSREELKAFMQAMRAHEFASHYYDFTVVLFYLGLRPSEAIGLRWGHVNLMRREIRISESLGRSDTGHTSGHNRVRRSTKTGHARTLPLNDRLVGIFSDRWHKGVRADELIFTTASGCPIDDHNYRERCFKPCCEDAGINYRPPYTARHTQISYGLEYTGWTQKEAAFMAGHQSTSMVDQHYSHLLNKPELPDLGI